MLARAETALGWKPSYCRGKRFRQTFLLDIVVLSIQKNDDRISALRRGGEIEGSGRDY